MAQSKVKLLSLRKAVYAAQTVVRVCLSLRILTAWLCPRTELGWRRRRNQELTLSAQSSRLSDILVKSRGLREEDYKKEGTTESSPMR